MDSMRLYDILYALVARDGRGAVLFGSDATASREAFSRSLAGPAFPEIWLEAPLAGEPWVDFHALISYEDVAGTQVAFSGQGGVYADALAWFAAQRQGAVRQLALSYDTSAGDVDHPAVQLLVGGRDVAVPLSFLEAVGRPDAKDPYRTFVGNMPEEWFACYVGAFPGRGAFGVSPWVRVECIVGDKLQRAYAEDVATLRDHLACVGVEGVDADALADFRTLARSPFPFELQFNVGPDGTALPVVSASARFQPGDWVDEASRENIERMARQLQDRGLVDGRWSRLSEILIAKRVDHEGASALLTCFPAFVKLRWRAGQPLDAKAYLLAQIEQL